MFNVSRVKNSHGRCETQLARWRTEHQTSARLSIVSGQSGASPADVANVRLTIMMMLIMLMMMMIL